MQKLSLKKIFHLENQGLPTYTLKLLQGKAYRIFNHTLAGVLQVHSLSIPHWKLLGQLYEHGSMRVADIATLLQVKPPLVTVLLTKLEEENYVRVVTDPTDKRAKLVSMTQYGKAFLITVEPQMQEIVGKLLAGVSEEELEIYRRVLSLIVKNGEEK